MKILLYSNAEYYREESSFNIIIFVSTKIYHSSQTKHVQEYFGGGELRCPTFGQWKDEEIDAIAASHRAKHQEGCYFYFFIQVEFHFSISI